MALILKAKNAVFENSIARFSPVANQKGWFDFGINEAESTKNLSGGPNLNPLIGSGTPISYSPNHVVFAQDSGGGWYRFEGVSAKGFSFASHAREGGLFERFYTIPILNSPGCIVDSLGNLVHSAILSDGSLQSVNLALKSRPLSVAGSIEENSVAGEITITLSAQYIDGSKSFVHKTFAGSLDASYDSADLDIGRSSSGQFLNSEFLVYERALTHVETEENLSYLFTKYS